MSHPLHLWTYLVLLPVHIVDDVPGQLVLLALRAVALVLQHTRQASTVISLCFLE